MQKALLLLFISITLAACIGPTKLFQLPSDYMAHREKTTRRFDESDTKRVMQAIVQTAQDMGFVIDTSEMAMGIITAVKKEDIDSTLNVIGSIFTGNASRTVAETLKFTVAVVKMPEGKAHTVRLEIMKTQHCADESIENESLDDAATYQDFFDRLGQSLLLEANSI